MNIMNRIFRRAFEHIAEKETMDELLECIGEELECDRVSVFEVHEDDYFDNTYEWCGPGVLSEHDFLQHLPFSGMSSWHRSIETGEILTIPDVEDLRGDMPELHTLFHAQGISSMIVCGLHFHGRDKGFVIIENPSGKIIGEAQSIMPVIRYILSALLHSEHLVKKLEKAGYSDALTGAGNRLNLQSHLETLDRDAPLGLIYCDALDWIRADRNPAHLDHDQMIIHAGATLQTVFDEDMVFRVGSGEFITLCPGIEEPEFQSEVLRMKALFLEQDIAAAVGTVWVERIENSYDAMIQEAHLIMYNARRTLVRDRKTREAGEDVAAAADIDYGSGEHARISLYRENEFFRKADEWLTQIYDEDVLTILVDIDYFRLYNDIFGRKAGNLFLEFIAEIVSEKARRHRGVCGYMGGDNFVLMLPVPGNYPEEQIRENVDVSLGSIDFADGFTPSIGIYISKNRQDTAIGMYDRALFALSEIRGNYLERCCIYSAEHFEHEKSDKLLLMDVKNGLEKGEFSFAVQPQVHIRSGNIIGCEALVRWKHNGEAVSIQHLVDVMEKNGYIQEVDLFLWEEVCRWQSGMKKKGLKLLPCSVNVSRMDFFFVDVAEEFSRLVKKYDLDPSLIGIEITESAFTDNLEQIQEAIQKLHEAGFRICMDDFGSGISSLSMLHKMNVDVLKTDVAFMNRMDPDNRAVCIVESVINMAHLIGVLVITEGIETEAQKETLASLGDHYAQGYYFYEPMEPSEFEKLLATDAVGSPPRKGGPIMTSRIKFRDMMHEGLLNDSLLDSIIGPAAVIRKSGDSLEVVQMNEAYSTLTGLSGLDDPAEDTFRVAAARHDTEEVCMTAFAEADEHPLNGAPAAITTVGTDGSTQQFSAKIFPLSTMREDKMYLSIIQEQGAPAADMKEERFK